LDLRRDYNSNSLLVKCNNEQLTDLRCGSATFLDSLLSKKEKCMLYNRLLMAITIMAILSLGCKKDFSTRKCEQLKTEMAADNVQEVIKLVTEKVNQLASQNYTRENLNTLATSLSGDCGISATVLCFGCIQTLPEQSEIRLSFNSSGSLVAKTIDISYTPDNKIKIINMHN
jgi:hypothetical protein